MLRWARLLALVVGATALRVPTPSALRGPQSLADAKPPRLSTLLAPALALSLTLPASAGLYEDVMVELNKPMVNLNPFSINPAGYFIIGLYAAFLAYQGVAPPSEKEKEYYAELKADAEVASAAAPAFLKTAAETEGAKVLPSGLVFCETVPGTGASPSADDTVSVHYEGKLYDGKVFDSSIARGKPTEFKVGQVIKGWQEGLQLMKVGGKATLTIPAELAYGPAAMGEIPGSSALQFEVELLEIVEGKDDFLSKLGIGKPGFIGD